MLVVAVVVDEEVAAPKLLALHIQSPLLGGLLRVAVCPEAKAAGGGGGGGGIPAP